MSLPQPPQPDPQSPRFPMSADRTLPWDWHAGRVPDNVDLDPDAYLETSYSFHLFHSTAPCAVRIQRGASIYLGTMFDLGPRGQIDIGQFTLMNGARVICDSQIDIGSHCLISWNVVLMDSYRVPIDPLERRAALEQLASRQPRRAEEGIPAKPIRIGHNVWIGFDVCVLPGVTIGDGAIVGARSVVHQNIPPFAVAAGNPARVIRQLNQPTATTSA